MMMGRARRRREREAREEYERLHPPTPAEREAAKKRDEREELVGLGVIGTITLLLMASVMFCGKS